MIDPRDIPGHRPDNDREQLAALGDSATIRPVSATRRNCWTCLHNLTAAGGYNYCGSPLYTGSAPDGAYRAVAEWIERYADDMDDGMPAKTADGCPGWVAKDEQATVKDSLVVRMLEGLTVEDAQHIAREHNRVVSAGFVGWRGHLPLCRGPGGIQARRLRALVRGVRR